MGWQLRSLVELHWHRWDDEWVAFDVGSGQTHQMDTLSAVTLLFLENSPADAQELATQVAKELRIPESSEYLNSLGDILGRLETSGLIETTSQ